MKKITSILAVLALAAAWAAPMAEAQQRLSTSGRPNFGARTLATGFMPDPVTIPVVSGGNLDVGAMNLAPGCTGYATSQPDFNLTMSNASRMLHFFVDAGDQDTTLIINKPDGSWVCADDTFGVNPGIDIANAAPGLYNIWIGSYRSGVQARGSLNITERSGMHPGGSAPPSPPSSSGGNANVSQLSLTARPNFGARTVTPGFPHDPMTVNVTSGGNIDAALHAKLCG